MADGLLGLPLLFLGLGGRGHGRRDGLPGRTRVEEQGAEDDDEKDEGDGGPSSPLDRLLRHDPVSTTSTECVDTRRAGAHPRGGVLLWIERNRRWLIPWISALIVVAIETAAWVFASKPIPVEGHAALGAFWVYAVGRGTTQALEAGRHQRRLELYAARRGISLDVAEGEWDAFLAVVERTPLPPDRGGKP